MDVGKSKIVWSGSDGCHVSQENVVNFFGWHYTLLFLTHMALLRIPDQGLTAVD